MSAGTAGTSPPVGDYFLVFNEHGDYQERGRIIGNPEPGFFLCQLYTGAMDRPSSRQLVPIAECVSWLLFETHEQWMVARRNWLKFLRAHEPPRIAEIYADLEGGCL